MPLQALQEIAELFQVKAEGEKETVYNIFQRCRWFYSYSRSKSEMKAHLDFLAVCVGKLQRHIHAKSYKQSSRARWPLTLRTLLKIVAGVTVILLHGGQRRVHNVLLMSPIFLHRAAVPFALADGTWGDNPEGSGGRMFGRAGPFVSDDLDSYWRMVEYAVFTMPETDFEE